MLHAQSDLYKNFVKKFEGDDTSRALFDEFLADPEAARGVLEGRDPYENDDDDNESYEADPDSQKPQILATPTDDAASKVSIFSSPNHADEIVKMVATLAMAYHEMNPLAGILLNESAGEKAAYDYVPHQSSGITGNNNSSSINKWAHSRYFKGHKIYQRDDLIDINLKDARGKTNLERMRNGNAPIGPDGKPINLHHTLQNQKGPLAEMTQTFHQEHSKVIHINPSSIPSGINRTEFDKWRNDYWIVRAKNFSENK